MHINLSLSPSPPPLSLTQTEIWNLAFRHRNAGIKRVDCNTQEGPLTHRVGGVSREVVVLLKPANKVDATSTKFHEQCLCLSEHMPTGLGCTSVHGQKPEEALDP